MVAIEVAFLTGRYHATPWMRHVNEGAAEWPPSPWRLFRALVALWLKYGKDEEKELFLSLLDKLAEEPPEFNLPQAYQAFTQHYMPQEKNNLKLVFDNFITTEKNAKCYIIWSKVMLTSNEETLLKNLLANLHYLGRVESWVEAKLVSEVIEPNVAQANEQKDANYDYKSVLVPKKTDELYNNLLRETSEYRKYGYLEPPGSKWVRYSLPDDLYRVNPRRYKLHQGTRYNVARYAVIEKPKPSVTDTLLVGEMLRFAAMSQYGRLTGGNSSITFAGKEKDQKPINGHTHAFYIPTDEDGDGRIDHITVYAPEGLDEIELMALSKIDTLKRAYGNWEYRLVLLGFWNTKELSKTVPIFKESKSWVTATPFLLGRYPKFKRSGQPRINENGMQIDGPIDQLQKEIASRVKTLNGDTKLVEITNPQYKTKRPAKHRYRTRRLEKSQIGPGELYNFKVEFSKPVKGPMFLGAYSHFGLGVFVPEGDI